MQPLNNPSADVSAVVRCQFGLDRLWWISLALSRCHPTYTDGVKEIWHRGGLLQDSAGPSGPKGAWAAATLNTPGSWNPARRVAEATLAFIGYRLDVGKSGLVQRGLEELP